jgi:deazaflavin-dependent oxidoreductase (nitroreductase family)
VGRENQGRWDIVNFMNAKDLYYKTWTSIHEISFKASNGRLAPRLYGMPVVMLTTTGRKSGKPRTTMLTSPAQDGENVVIVASYGGDARHPAWFLNLRENPDVEIMMLGKRRRMLARVATPDEKEALWPRITASFRNYGEYQKRTERDIPVVILEPAVTQTD